MDPSSAENAWCRRVFLGIRLDHFPDLLEGSAFNEIRFPEGLAMMQNMNVAVDESWNNDAIVQINDCGTFRDLDLRTDIGNAVILDDHALGEVVAVIGR